MRLREVVLDIFEKTGRQSSWACARWGVEEISTLETLKGIPEPADDPEGDWKN